MARQAQRAKYRRRRLGALVALLAVAVLIVVAIRGGDDAGPPTPATAAEERRAELEQEPIGFTASVSGDILIHSPLYQRALADGGGNSYDFRPMFRQIRPFIAEPDLAICHLETPLTEGAPQSFPIFATPATLADAIADTGWDACTTASNHSLDQGLEGIKTTGRALDRAGVAHTGSAATARRSRRPLILDVRGAKVGLLAYTTMTNGIPLPEPWSVNLAAPERILADARRARRRGAEAVLVNVHWGDEDSTEINAEQLGIARALTNSRAVTALVGQGPHVVQPIRRVNGSQVVFSEGNLISNQTPACCAPGSQDGLIALLDVVIDGDGDRLTDVRYVPTWVRHPDFSVLPVGPAARQGEADPAVLRASYERTVGVAGRGRGVEPVPRQAP